MGRFVHEAIAVDRKTGIVYLTEDYNPCGFYRFLPNRNKRMAEGGVLQMLAVKGQDRYDTRISAAALKTCEKRTALRDPLLRNSLRIDVG